MPIHSLVKIYVHIIWATHKRERDLHEQLRNALHAHFLEELSDLGVEVEALNIQPEHVHLLIALPAEMGVARVTKALKGESSRWINEQNLAGGRFQWQRGYGGFSVSASQLAKVKTYVENQDAHHAKKTFADEYKAWAEQYGLVAD